MLVVYKLAESTGWSEGAMVTLTGRCNAMRLNAFVSGLAFFVLFISACPHLSAQAGHPFQTDDPTPVDLGHYEAYVFGTVDGTPAELDTISPGFEFNCGAIPNIQLHVILPLGEIILSNKPVYAPGGIGPSAFGVQYMELGFKYGFIKHTKHRPQIGSFMMFEIPTGSYSKGLGAAQHQNENPHEGARARSDWPVLLHSMA